MDYALSLLRQSPGISMCTGLTSAANTPGELDDLTFSSAQTGQVRFSFQSIWLVKNHKPHLAIRDSFRNNSASIKDVVQTSAIIKNHTLPYRMDSGDKHPVCSDMMLSSTIWSVCQFQKVWIKDRTLSKEMHNCMTHMIRWFQSE